MKRYVVLIGCESEVAPTLVEAVFRAALSQLEKKGFVGEHGIHVRELEGDEKPTLETLGLIKMGKA